MFKKGHLLSFLGLALPILSHAASSDWKTNPEGQVRLIAADNGVAKNGTLWLGLHFKTAPGWYVYWKQAGDAGYPPNVKWDSSRGIKNPEWLWPAPTKIVLPGNIVEYGYEDEVVYPVRAELAASGKQVHVSATLSYLTCYTSCIPYRYTFTLDLPVGMRQPDKEAGPLIERFLKEVPPAQATDAEILRAAPTVRKNPMPASEGATGAPPLKPLALLLLAFFGGLLLNVMPCVLPVLSIKLLGLVQQAGHSHPRIVRNSLLSAAGIVTSFLTLAGIAVASNAGGRAVGWGIQFQSPVFVMVLAAIVFLFALNLWGIFEIGMPRIFGHFATTFGQRETPVAHFMSGLFATALATPCSAPFLGTAMGFALSQPPATVFSAFFAAGTGMAFPYLLLAAFPRSLNWLPKPGPWMIRMKFFFGFLLAGTAVWLLWVFLHQVRPVPHEPFDETKIQSLWIAGTPVLVDVTADWCVTCKYNERFILDSRDVKQALDKRGVVVMRADWTNRNETIRLYLAKFGRSGIPFYVFYEPGREPAVLSEFLTKRRVLDVLGAR